MEIAPCSDRYAPEARNDLLYGQRAKAVIRQADYHECSGNNVVDVTVLIPQSAVQGQTFQLAFLITD